MVPHLTHPPAFSDISAPSHAQSAPVATRAGSISSSRSYTRRHRHARSHQGGGTGSHLPQNEFPVFSQTGDVEIIITNARGRRENLYLLHRLILSQCSGFFEAGTSAQWSHRPPPSNGAELAGINEDETAAPSGVSRVGSRERRSSYDADVAGSKQRWKYVVDWKGCTEGETPMLVRQAEETASIFGRHNSVERPPPVRNKPPASNESFFRSMTNFSALSLSDRSPREAPAPGDEILKDYDNLFRTMYQYPPNLDSINIASAYTECKALLHLADMYDALEIVGSRVDHHLLRFGVRLFKQIAKYPPSYLKLGYLARSQTIFTEALIHVVGQWPLGSLQLKNQIDAAVMDLIEDKVDELREVEERVEFKLWRLTLTTSRGERVTPANDYLTWLAISLFRQWLAENTTPPPSGILKDTSHTDSRSQSQHVRSSSRSSSNHVISQRTSEPAQPQGTGQSTLGSTGRAYRLLGSTSNVTYLNADDLKRFLKLQPDLYHRDNLKRLERRMDEIKNLARDIVAPLMRNFLELDLTAFGPAGLGYLTCTKLTERELPWER